MAKIVDPLKPRMTKIVDLRIKVFPADLKAQLKSEAALQGITLTEYIVRILQERVPWGKT